MNNLLRYDDPRIPSLEEVPDDALIAVWSNGRLWTSPRSSVAGAASIIVALVANDTAAAAANTDAINAAIVAANAASVALTGPCTVQIPDGLYYTTLPALLSGVRLRGAGQDQTTLCVSGNVVLPANTSVEDIGFKQRTPGGGTRRTLTSAGGDSIRLVNVTVDRNGDGTNGAHQVDAGVYIDGGSGHYCEGVEVYGDDIGTGFALFNATDSDLVRVRVHDIKYLLGADPGNDRVQGIHLSGCTRANLYSCSAHDIGGDFGGGYTLRYSRGYCFSGNIGVKLIGCRTWMVDQGYDTTGGVGNSRFQFGDCYASDCLTYGFKFANTARDGQVNNCVAERCALSGFIASGPTGAGMTALATRNITFTACTAYDIGYVGLPGVAVAGGKIGFRASNGTFDLDTTLGIRFVNCRAIDRQAVRTMANGFSNDVAASTDPLNGYNEAVNCISIGNLGASFDNMHSARCEVSRVAVQAIPTATWTAVDWTADADYGAMHSTSSSNSNVYARRAGTYSSRWGVAFAANATGQRGVRILREGVVIPGTTVLVDAAASGETSLQATWTSLQNAGDNLRIEVWQSSGGNLNLQTTSGGIVEQVD